MHISRPQPQRITDKNIIVDIDDTLWPLAPTLHDELSLHYSIPPVSEWSDFGWWKKFMTIEEFWTISTGISLRQDQYDPYPEAHIFLLAIKEMGFNPIIASHRKAITSSATQKFIIKNELACGHLHISQDKTVLFDQNCIAVIDDNPDILEKAAMRGIPAFGLKCPWNREKRDHLYDNLFDILDCIKALKDQPTEILA